MTTSSTYFPLVSPAGVCKGEIKVDRVEQLDGSSRNIRAPELPKHVVSIVEASREQEQDMASRLVGVAIRVKGFEGAPSGFSYGLALAISDKTVRSCGPSIPPGREIWATGVIDTISSGEVRAVEQFEQKLEFVANRATETPIIFYFSSEQLPLVDEFRAANALLFAEAKLELRPIESVEELSPSVAPKKTDEKPISVGNTEAGKQVRRIPLAVIIGTLGIAALAIGVWGWQRLSAPAQLLAKCETALELASESEAHHDGNDKTVRLCERAMKVNAENVGLLEQIAQFYLKTGNREKALQAWNDAAELGSDEARSVLVFEDWRSDPRDPTITRKAIDVLEQSAELGSATAMDLLPIILMDGRAVPPAPEKVEYWNQRREEHAN